MPKQKKIYLLTQRHTVSLLDQAVFADTSECINMSKKIKKQYDTKGYLDSCKDNWQWIPSKVDADNAELVRKRIELFWHYHYFGSLNTFKTIEKMLFLEPPKKYQRVFYQNNLIHLNTT